MNTRSKLSLLSGNILEYFSSNKAPQWEKISKIFLRYNLTKLTGMETLSPHFLRELFQNSDDLIDKIEFFKQHHHYLTILLMKDEYSLDACLHCGYITRKIAIDCENNQEYNNQEWNI
jgi:hypothetical protein